MPDGALLSVETRLTRLESIPDALERLERAVERIGERLEVMHRLEQQQASHSSAIDRAFKAIEKVTTALDDTRGQLTSRVTKLEHTFAERMGMARGTITTAGSILGVAQLAAVAAVGYLFSHLAAAETALAERAKADALFEQRLVLVERHLPQPVARQ